MVRHDEVITAIMMRLGFLLVVALLGHTTLKAQELAMR